MHLQTARALYRVVVHLALFFGVKSSATSAQREVHSAVMYCTVYMYMYSQYSVQVHVHVWVYSTLYTFTVHNARSAGDNTKVKTL